MRLNEFDHIEDECDRCLGLGRHPSGDGECPECKGTGKCPKVGEENG